MPVYSEWNNNLICVILNWAYPGCGYNLDDRLSDENLCESPMVALFELLTTMQNMIIDATLSYSYWQRCKTW